MPKKKSWFLRVREFFFPGSDQQEGKRNKKRRLFRWIKRPRPLGIASLSTGRTENNVTNLQQQQQGHQIVPVAAASEAAAAKSARFDDASLPISYASTRQQEDSHGRCFEDFAAVKIQTAFRGYLARKALKALKGFVRLQAIIRGRAVRRQTLATLKYLQSIVNIQSQVCTTRYQMVQAKRKSGDSKRKQDLKYDKLKLKLQSQRRCNHSLITKDEENDMMLSKTEVMMKRNRTKAYSFNHRHSAELEGGRTNGRIRYWLEHQMGEQVPQKEEIKRVDTIGGKQLTQAQHITEPTLDSPAMVPRMSFHYNKRRPSSSTATNTSENKPAYMAATESARAKARSTSSTRLRPMHLDSYSDGDSPYKTRLWPMSAINSERTCGGAGGGVMKQRSSPRFKMH